MKEIDIKVRTEQAVKNFKPQSFLSKRREIGSYICADWLKIGKQP